jgi:hypothetical protein
MPQVLYIEWNAPAPDVAGELRRGLQDRLEGSRGVHASFCLQDGPRLAVFMVVDSLGMLDAYARWCRLRMERLAGVQPSRHETFQLLGAVEGAAGLDAILRGRRAA